MISTKKHIQQLAAILIEKGVTDIIISPGSRNGPLIHTLAGCGEFNCRNIIDERSAGYFAIGLSQSAQKPVVLVCSSGTATLNYAPAIAEAFYLKIPLIVITADRPDYWINQGESQCIPQKNIYADFTTMEVSLPLGETEKELWQGVRLCNESINAAFSNAPGPVHINIPLEEPLHDLVDEKLPKIKSIDLAESNAILSETEIKKLSAAISKSQNILVLAGQQNPNKKLELVLANWAYKSGAVVLKEHLSNLKHPILCGSIDTLMASLLNDKIENFKPDLLISFGGQFVSKALKQFLRSNSPAEHWHLSLSNEHFDTYQSLTKVIPCEALSFFSQLENTNQKEKTYQNRWKGKETQVNISRDAFMKKAEFSDLSVYNQIKSHLPKHSVVHLGNSSPVRYALICEAHKDVEYFGNRGTSGIDGSLSTAVGFTSNSDKINTIVLGDLSFFYDSNALWNNYIQKNLRIIVVNNGGGNIFGLIKGPSDSPAFEEHLLTKHNRKAEGLAKAFNLDYFKAENADELNKALELFYSDKQDGAALLEVFTDAETNTQVFRSLFKEAKI